MPQPYKLFTIYAREDAQYLKELRGQLRPLEIGGRIKVWSDSEINPGVDWENEIVQNLDTADIILILVSAAYYDSAYIHEKEINYAIMRHERGEAKVLPIIVRPCSFGDDPIISRLQVLPTDGKPVNDRRHWHERDDAWLDVVAGVKRTIDLLREAEHNREQEILAAKKQEEDAAFAAQQEAERKRLAVQQEREAKEHARQLEKEEQQRLKKEQTAQAKQAKQEKEAAEQLILLQKIEEEKREEDERISREKEAKRLVKERIALEQAEKAHREEESAWQQQYVEETPLPIQRAFNEDRSNEIKSENGKYSSWAIFVTLGVVLIVAILLGRMLYKNNHPIEVATEGGNRVIKHTNFEGPKATYGSTVIISVNTWVNDSLVQSTSRDAGGPREIVVPDSSMMKGKVPAVFEALLLMASGDSATVIQPLDSIMKSKVPKSFGELKEIRYEVKLEDILSPDDIQKREQEKAKKVSDQIAVISETVKSMLSRYKSKTLENLKKSKSGLEYVIIEKGVGAPVKDGDTVLTSYYGVRRSDGGMFDNSYDRGDPPKFTVGALIPGFNEGMMLLNRGGKALLFIPSKLGYGNQGRDDGIPPNTDLVFYLEIED